MNSLLIIINYLLYYEFIHFLQHVLVSMFRGILMNTMHSDIYCTTSSTDRSKLPKHSFFSDTSQDVSSTIYMLALRHLFQRVRERMSTSCLNSFVRRYWRLRALYIYT
jgi:hypothetical protein